MAEEKKDWTNDMEEAFEIFNAPVQCGHCYVWYSPEDQKEGCCPLCGSDEWVGSR
jgi:Zn finger protein HypA/HybF involved in hydrogenase expression